ncbi:Ankyrin repeat protein 1 [Giardia muris]|uniref:Ankyrin repeat protein 1 n=1 Tax=Giardia muris TaxID=5742 RepID=A0A4Z1T0Y2_GIAMU|nr:Ankyrin repeat protein 1 [Giardia muris]|eukprot:TNJ26179.1 Ankyrin repeat protein 1 [Giardia muris]
MLSRLAEALRQRPHELPEGSLDFKDIETGDTIVHIAAAVDAAPVVIDAYRIRPTWPTNRLGETPLHVAASSNALSTLEALLELVTGDSIPSGREFINARNVLGHTALHYAIIFDSVECFDALIYSGVELHMRAQDGIGWTALHYAAVNARSTIIRTLLERDPDLIGVVSSAGVSILHLLSLADSALIIQRGHPSIRYCISQSYKQKDEEFQERRTYVNNVEYGEFKVDPEDFDRCLRIICIDSAEMISTTALVSALGPDNLGRVPLHYAAFQGSYQALYMLSWLLFRLIPRENATGNVLAPMLVLDGTQLTIGPSPFLKLEAGLGFTLLVGRDNLGMTPLHLACLSGMAATKVKLLASYCDLSSICTSLGSILHCCARGGCFETLCEVVDTLTRLYLLKTNGEHPGFLLDLLLVRDYHGLTAFDVLLRSDSPRIRQHATEQLDRLVTLLPPDCITYLVLHADPLTTMLQVANGFSPADLERMLIVVLSWYRSALPAFSHVFPSGVYQDLCKYPSTTRIATRSSFGDREVLPTVRKHLQELLLTSDGSPVVSPHTLDGFMTVYLSSLERLGLDGANNGDLGHSIWFLVRTYALAVETILHQRTVTTSMVLEQGSYNAAIRTTWNLRKTVLDVPCNDLSSHISEEPRQAPLRRIDLMRTVRMEVSRVLELPPAALHLIHAAVSDNKLSVMLLLAHLGDYADMVATRLGLAHLSPSHILQCTSMDKTLEGTANECVAELISKDTHSTKVQPNTPLEDALSTSLKNTGISFAHIWRVEAVMNAAIGALLADNYGLFCVLCSLNDPVCYRLDLLLSLIGTVYLGKFMGPRRLVKLRARAFAYIEFVLEVLVVSDSKRALLENTFVLDGVQHLVPALLSLDTSSEGLASSLRTIAPLIISILAQLEDPMITDMTMMKPVTYPRIPFLSFLLREGPVAGPFRYTQAFLGELKPSISVDLRPFSVPTLAIIDANGNTPWHYFGMARLTALCDVPELLRRTVKSFVSLYGGKAILIRLYRDKQVYGATHPRLLMLQRAALSKGSARVRTLHLFDPGRRLQDVVSGAPPDFGRSMLTSITHVPEDLHEALINEGRFYEGTSPDIATLFTALIHSVFTWVSTLQHKLEALSRTLSRIPDILNCWTIELSPDEKRILDYLILCHLGHSIGSPLAQNCEGRTPLELAVQFGEPVVVLLLLFAGVGVVGGQTLGVLDAVTESISDCLQKRVETALAADNPAEIITSLHLTFLLATLQPRFAGFLRLFSAFFRGIQTPHGKHAPVAVGREQAGLFQLLLARAPLTLNACVDEHPLAMLCRVHLVRPRSNSMYSLMKEEAIAAAFQRCNTFVTLQNSADQIFFDGQQYWVVGTRIAPLEGTNSKPVQPTPGSMCDICNTEPELLGRLFWGHNVCRRCQRTVCNSCTRRIRGDKWSTKPVCASCFAEGLVPDLLAARVPTLT